MRKKTHIILLVTMFIMGIFGTAFAADPFSDVPAKHWAYGAVTSLSKAGLIEGYNDGTFSGDKVISRYEMAILVARIISKTDKADAEQKKLIEKLTKEYADELESLNVRVTKLEKRTSTVEKKTNNWFNGETRIRYYGDIPGQPGYKRLQGADKFDMRERLIFRGDINDKITWNAQIETSPVKFGNTETMNMDVMNVTMKDFIGLDSLRLGRYALDAFGAALYGKPTNADAVVMKKKIGVVDVKGYVGNIKAATAGVMSVPNTMYSMELGFKPDPSLSVKTSVFYSDIPTTQADMNIALGSFDSSKGYDLSVLKKFGKLNLLGEYMSVHLDKAIGMPTKSPKGWFLQLSNGVPMPFLYPISNLVDVKKPGTDAWMVSYHSIDPGTLPAGVGGYSMMTSISYTNSGPGAASNSGWGNYNIYSKGSDNVNAWYLAYQKVLAKNFLISFDYQLIDIKNRAATTLVAKRLDQCYLMKFEYFY